MTTSSIPGPSHNDDDEKSYTTLYDEEFHQRYWSSIVLSYGPYVEAGQWLKIVFASTFIRALYIALVVGGAWLLVVAPSLPLNSLQQQLHIGLGVGAGVMLITPLLVVVSHQIGFWVHGLVALIIAGLLSVAPSVGILHQIYLVSAIVALTLCLGLDLVFRRLEKAAVAAIDKARRDRAANQEALEDAEQVQSELQGRALNGGTVAETIQVDTVLGWREARRLLTEAGLNADEIEIALARNLRLKDADPSGHAWAQSQADAL